MRIRPTSALRTFGWPAWLASLLLFALLCAIVAHWAVVLLAPRAPLAPAGDVTDPRALPELRLAATVFGLDRSSAAAARPSNIQVSGIVAAGARGSAILAIDGKPPRVYAVGEALGPAQRLLAVRSDAVVIASGDERVELPAPPAASIAVLDSGANAPAAPSVAPLAVPPPAAAPGAGPLAPAPAVAPPPAGAPVLRKDVGSRAGN